MQAPQERVQTVKPFWETVDQDERKKPEDHLASTRSYRSREHLRLAYESVRHTLLALTNLSNVVTPRTQHFGESWTIRSIYSM